MWYAIWVTTGYEDRTVNMCKRLVPQEYYKECFIPRVEQSIKYQGQWHSVKKVMFPGYIFIITDHIQEVYFALKAVPEFTKILGDLQEPISLYENEVTMLETLKNRDNIIEMSKGYMENDKITITEGPLMNCPGVIKKIDRHKRVAIIEVEMFGRTTEAKVGLEIVRKIKI